MNGRPVTIRTLDLGADKADGSGVVLASEPNPALGLRGVRLSLARRPLFETQLRAILRASGYGAVRILVPMVSRREEMVDHLLKAGANVDHADGRGKTALMRAALGGDGAMVERLLKAKPDVNLADGNGWTALICAAAGDVALIDRLIAAGAVVDHTTKDGRTALMRASAAGHGDAVARLEIARLGGKRP